jgi:hypothetical protein
MSKLYVNEIHPKTAGGTITTTGFPVANNVKEVLTMLCDGGTYTVPSGTYTSTNVDAVQNLTSTFTDVNGSVISYTPPAGTTAVVYEFTCQVSRASDAHSIGSYKFFIDGAEVVYNRHSVSANSNPELVTTFKYVIPIGGTANTNTGRQASWSVAKTLKIQAREHGGNNEQQLNRTYYFGGAVNQQFSTPILTITALGG